MITVIGEMLVDLIEESSGEPVAHPGGSPANVAVALARLGQPVNLLTQVGDDPHGQLLLKHLQRNGVDLASGSLVDCPRTSSARTSLSQDGQASYTFDIAWRHFRAPAAALLGPTPDCVHTGSLASMLLPGAEDVAAVVRAARQTSTVSFDPNCRPSLIDDPSSARDRVAALVAHSDIVKASVDDLAWLYPHRAFQDVGRGWLDQGCGLVVVTMGGAGAWACTRQRETAVDACPVGVVDTVGAGDAFTAGLLAGLSHTDLLGATRRDALAAIDEASLTEVLTYAARVAAITCGRRGANPPTATDLATSEA